MINKKKIITFFTAIITIINCYGQTADSLFKEGLIKFSEGDMRSAIIFFTKAIDLKPDISGGYFMRASAKSILEDHRGVISDLTKAIDSGAKDTALLYFGRGFSKSKINENISAIVDYTSAIKLKPDFQSAYHERGKSKSSLEDYRGAILDFTKAIGIKPDSDSYTQRGICKYHLKDDKGAILDYNKAIELKPDNFLPYACRGISKIRLGQKESACLDFSKSGELGNEAAYLTIKELCK